MPDLVKQSSDLNDELDYLLVEINRTFSSLANELEGAFETSDVDLFHSILVRMRKPIEFPKQGGR